jgi:hypothetical protein
VDALRLYSFHQKCSKLGTLTTQGLKISDERDNFKNAFMPHPLKINVFRKFEKFHVPNKLDYLMGDFNKVSSQLKH